MRLGVVGLIWNLGLVEWREGVCFDDQESKKIDSGGKKWRGHWMWWLYAGQAGWLKWCPWVEMNQTALRL